jgi:hypothetical protein
MRAWVVDRGLRLALILGATVAALAVLYGCAMTAFVGAVFLGMGWAGTSKGLLEALSPVGHVMVVSVLGASGLALPVGLAMPRRYWGYGAAVAGVAGAGLAVYVPVVDRALAELACWDMRQLGPDLCAM